MKKHESAKDQDLPEFDVMAKMAKEDPEALEALRRDMIDQLINKAPQEYHRKLRGLQFKIDMERERAKTPMASCIKLSQMMHDSFLELRDTLRQAQQGHVNQLKQRRAETAKNPREEDMPVKHGRSGQTHPTQTRSADIVKFPVPEV